MNILVILALSLGALALGWIVPLLDKSADRRGLRYALLLSSLLALYGLQPSSPLRNLDYWLPTASIALTLLCWAIVAPPEGRTIGQALPGLLVLLGLPLALAFTRFLGPLCCLTASRPPQILPVLSACLVIAGLFLAIYLGLPRQKWLPWAGIGLILALFILLKSASLSQAASGWLRRLNGQDVGLASATDLPWLGFSFLAFRLLQVLRDYQARRLPASRLSDFAVYALFFPSIVSGPIDRWQHFSSELEQASNRPYGALKSEGSDSLSGLARILAGCVKKFVLADNLALLALNPQNAAQTHSAGWMWLLLLAYALRIYWDFAGYSDIAIGLARLVGIGLPENFDRPYLKQNLTAFWNSWHITLSQWFRAYIFFPLTRALRSGGSHTPAWLTILAGQLATMALIGLWHGISWNFLMWGAWHGVGLFVQNRWSEWVKGRRFDRWRFNRGRLNREGEAGALPRPLRMAIQAGGWALTFSYVCLGWVWFALPSPALAWHVFGILF